MARRYNKRDLDGAERPTSGPIPLAGLIRLQSGRNRKGNKTWRPLQPSDLGDGEGLEESLLDESSPPVDMFGWQPSFDAPHQSSPQLGPPRSSPFDLPPINTSVGNQPLPTMQQDTSAPRLSSPSSVGSDGISPKDTRFGVVESYMRLFGQLPDLIRLHEQTGDFDGQIVFIGHPNRDVSAHQWSSASFQWVNIGLWSHTRCRVEGSLASDRYPEANLAYNTIEYFKFVAENREKVIKECGRPQEEPDPGASRPSVTEADRTASLSSASSSPNGDLMRADRYPGVAGDPEYQNVVGERLEDPFVTPARPANPAVPNALRFRGSGSGPIGSMDFNYEFPLKTPASFGTQNATTNWHDLYIQRERERLDSIRRGESTHERLNPAYLPDIAAIEEELSTLAPSSARLDSSRPQAPPSPEDVHVHNRQQLKNRLNELAENGRKMSMLTEQRVAVPEFPTVNTNIRALFPPGPTVANPYRGTSTLNANAAPYFMPSTKAAEKPELEVSTTNTQPTSNLHFSDPDGIRQGPVHEIANGLGQQVPTPQNFNGPFFGESMPTTHDPTAILTIQVSDEEKLMNWYRDGQRPGRQQEYAKSLVAAAHTGNRARSFGTIGTGSFRVQDPSRYENTPFFVRVYENLFEYAEESREGSGSNYFTRVWKPAPTHLCDLTTEGNNSFFNIAPRAMSPKEDRKPKLQSVWSQASASRGAAFSEAQAMAAAKFRHGVIADGGFGGPVTSDW